MVSGDDALVVDISFWVPELLLTVCIAEGIKTVDMQKNKCKAVLGERNGKDRSRSGNDIGKVLCNTVQFYRN